MENSEALKDTFLSFSREKLMGEMWPRLCTSLNDLSEEQIWWRPNEASNSIGNLLLHLNGNVRQWIVQALGGVENVRDRDSEFSETGPMPIAELRERLETTLRQVDAILQNLSTDDLARKHKIQVYEGVTAMEAIYHVVEHFALHYGQILYVAKMLKGQGLGFYDYLSKTAQV